jgi:hypothetical protein
MAGESAKYLKWIRSLPCDLAGHGVCSGPVDAHHRTGSKGIGQRNHDHQTYPLCRQHHIFERHALKGYFSGWVKAQIRDFESARVTHYRRLYLGLGADDDV